MKTKHLLLISGALLFSTAGFTQTNTKEEKVTNQPIPAAPSKEQIDPKQYTTPELTEEELVSRKGAQKVTDAALVKKREEEKAAKQKAKSGSGK